MDRYTFSDEEVAYEDQLTTSELKRIARIYHKETVLINQLQFFKKKATELLTAEQIQAIEQEMLLYPSMQVIK
jgi:hypothetical protein